MRNLVENKKARFNYEILETFEAGMELFGFEVKSLRAGHGSLEGAFVGIRGGEAYLLNATIPPYQPKNVPREYDPLRARRLLLTKKEIARIASFERQKHLTIIPISVYHKKRNLKLSIAIARGKKKFDKREIIKRRETDREVRRSLKNF